MIVDDQTEKGIGEESGVAGGRGQALPDVNGQRELVERDSQATGEQTQKPQGLNSLAFLAFHITGDDAPEISERSRRDRVGLQEVRDG